MSELALRTPELRPEIVFIFDLVQQLVDGRLRIPQFQRPFVWRPNQMIDLLDSVNKQYPIGSLLAWETDEDLVSLETVGPLRFAPSRSGAAAYLLDGHQRLSTLAGALVGESNRDKALPDEDALLWNIYFNASERIFEHLPPRTQPAPFQFPMSKILDTFEFLRESQRVLDQDPENGRSHVERIQEVARSFQNYKIPVMQIKQTGLSEAVEIFARLNSRGQSMTADQMVSALLYRVNTPDPFNLANAISESLSLLKSGGVRRHRSDAHPAHTACRDRRGHLSDRLDQVGSQPPGEPAQQVTGRHSASRREPAGRSPLLQEGAWRHHGSVAPIRNANDRRIVVLLRSIGPLSPAA